MGAKREPVFPFQAGYPPTWRGNYARLVEAEVKLMDWYLDAYGHELTSLWYDVKTDGVPGEDPHEIPADLTDDPAMIRMWKAQTSKRMDAVGLAPDGYRIIELRADAAPQSLGEILQYMTLARGEWPELQWTRPVLVTVNIDHLVARSILEQGITIVRPPPIILELARSR